MSDGLSTTVLALCALAVLFLLALSFFFSGAETALTATSRARMLQLENGGDRRAALVNRLLEARERLIGALLICLNLVNTAAASLTTGVLLALLGDVGVIYATVVVSVLVIVFCEVMPKTVAIAEPERAARLVAPIVKLVVVAVGPVTLTVEWFVRAFLRLFGIRIGAGTNVLSGTEEIRGTVDLLAKEGSVEREQQHMLGGLLDLSDLTVSDIMVHRTTMVAFDADRPTPELLDAILDSPFTRSPLWRGEPENIVGIVHVKALIRAVHAAQGDLGKVVIDEVMTPPWFIPDSTPVEDQLKAFLKRKAHIALVVDEYGEVMGLVTLEDILEEIVGDISDETDEEIPGCRVQPDGTVTADGQVPIRDLNRKMDWELPDEEATTIAGLVIHEARAIPEPGQTFTFYGFKFEVLRRERNRITRLRITPTADARRARSPQGAPAAAGG